LFFYKENDYLNSIRIEYLPIRYEDSLNGVVNEVFIPKGLRYNYTSCYLVVSGKKLKILTLLSDQDSVKFRYFLNKGDNIVKARKSLLISVRKANNNTIRQFYLDTTNTQVW
jgi:hypothetical protein